VLLEKAAGQGHAYAMHELAKLHTVRNQFEQGEEWLTEAAEAGLPKAMFNLGRAVQVDPMKPTLKAPGSERLKLECDDLLSNVVVEFNLRHYT